MNRRAVHVTRRCGAAARQTAPSHRRRATARGGKRSAQHVRSSGRGRSSITSGTQRAGKVAEDGRRGNGTEREYAIGVAGRRGADTAAHAGRGRGAGGGSAGVGNSRPAVADAGARDGGAAGRQAADVVPLQARRVRVDHDVRLRRLHSRAVPDRRRQRLAGRGRAADARQPAAAGQVPARLHADDHQHRQAAGHLRHRQRRQGLRAAARRRLAGDAARPIPASRPSRSTSWCCRTGIPTTSAA